MAFKIIDLPITLGTLGFIKVLKYLKEESLDKKQFHLTDINIFAKYMQESEKFNPSMFNMLSSWYHEIVMLIATNGASFIVMLLPCFSLLTLENGLEKHARNVTEK